MKNILYTKKEVICIWVRGGSICTTIRPFFLQSIFFFWKKRMNVKSCERKKKLVWIFFYFTLLIFIVSSFSNILLIKAYIIFLFEIILNYFLLLIEKNLWIGIKYNIQNKGAYFYVNRFVEPLESNFLCIFLVVAFLK